MGVVGLYEYELRCSPNRAIIGGYTQKINTERPMNMVASVKKADTGLGEGPVGEEKLGIIDSERHRRRTRGKQHGFHRQEARIVNTNDVDGMDGEGRETGFEVFTR